MFTPPALLVPAGPRGFPGRIAYPAVFHQVTEHRVIQMFTTIKYRKPVNHRPIPRRQPNPPTPIGAFSEGETQGRKNRTRLSRCQRKSFSAYADEIINELTAGANANALFLATNVDVPEERS